MHPSSSALPAHPVSRPAAASEDDELEQIMRDVGNQLKNEDFKKPKRRFLSIKPKPKRDVPFSAQIVHNPQQFHKTEPKPAPVAPTPRPVVADIAPTRPQLTTQVRDQVETEKQLTKIQPHPKAQAAAKPKNRVSYPVFVLFVTFLVTGFLIAAAIAAYRQ